MAQLSYGELFKGSELFFELLLKQSQRTHEVVARIYSNGAWQQISGNDFCAHLGRAVDFWLKEFPLEERREQKTILLLQRNSYNSFIATLGGICAGLNIMCMPPNLLKKDIGWCIERFQALAIALDVDELGSDYEEFHLPILNISQAVWLPQDQHREPPLLSLYREYRATKTSYMENSDPSVSYGEIGLTKTSRLWAQTIPGKLCFVSFGHDGFQIPESHIIDALVLTAQNFLIHVNAPRETVFKSVEMLLPSNPFAHLSRFAVLLKGGILGFPNLSATWEANLKILRPTVLFASNAELEQICHFVQEMAKQNAYRPGVNLSNKLEKVRSLMQTGRAMKLPEDIFHFANRALLKASRMMVGGAFVKKVVEDLRFIVHGMAPANEAHVRILEQVGIPVLESFGTTHGAGMLSCNTFDAPHFNLIGSPLPHVNFRLGVNSTLEYKISSPLFENAGKWEETGDIVQMTPFGMSITGRRTHLVVTLGGLSVSPLKLEQLLKEHEEILDACVIGDKLPYLSTLIVLNPASNILDEEARDVVQNILGKINEKLPRNVTIKKFLILDKPFSESAGEKLVNGEINRLKIQETRADQIASLYH